MQKCIQQKIIPASTLYRAKIFVFYDKYRKIMYTIKKRTSKRLKQNGYMYTDNKSSFEKNILFIQTAYNTNVYICRHNS